MIYSFKFQKFKEYGKIWWEYGKKYLQESSSLSELCV